ncbi:MAG: 16S rRNA (guanine(966)-N(2))-methyltransferase RsmD [Clostridia bacterium]|nr:16S rRNA (guanine(966)-N(2))-methyltransferase RsmD [Clostridia bacterium]
MRVISGIAKGTILYTLQGNNTRPTLDRVKEALFNIIQNRMLEATVLDLFSGSGAIGIEAISRGAKKAVLCDNSKAAISIIKKNLEKTHLEDKAILIKEDYKEVLRFLGGKKVQFDFIFLDPPYAEDMTKKAVEEIIKGNLLKQEGIIVIETDEEARILEEIKNMKVNVYDLRKYGRIKLIFLNRKG